MQINPEVIGYIAAFCTTISFLPQLFQIVKTRQTRDISLFMYLLLTLGITLWLIYGIQIHAYPIIIANTLTLIQSVIILGIKVGCSESK